MNGCWWTNGSLVWSMLLLNGIFQLNFILCRSLNHEGIALLKFRERVVNDPYGALASWNEENGEANPCSWFGIGCVGGHVISLNLKNLCLEGTLAPELHHLLYIKSIILRNNSFSGFVPGEYRSLKELGLLDLSYNDFYKPFPHEIEHNIPKLLIDNNGLSCHISPDQEDTTHPSQLTSSVEVLQYPRDNDHAKEFGHSRILLDQFLSKIQGPSGEAFSPDETRAGSPELSGKSPDGQSPFKHPPLPLPSPEPHSEQSPPPNLSNESQPTAPPQPPPVSSLLPPPPPALAEGPRNNLIRIVAGAVGGFVGLILVSLLLFLLRSDRIRKPTGLSGQLKRAFVAGNARSDGLNNDKPSFIEGMPNLQRSELVTACEDFSNVIGSSSIGTIYKGTLSNGVEIAVISLVETSAKDWSKNLETQFRKKIETLSKVNNKNFVNLIGYCEEEEPFTRIMVFEYAPNGSLFEHLHVREAEHLDWGMRLRVAMGIAYCLEYMHQLTPPVTHPNLNSSAVNLSEDYAAKISDFCFWNEVAAPRVQPLAIGMSSLSTKSVSLESNVHSFGLLLLEMMTGRIPHSLENSSLDDWVLEYMRGEQTLQEMVDPMLRHFKPEQLDKISEVIRKCLHSEQNRPTMSDITARMKEITGIIPDKAVPRFSSLWWTELDARSVNGT